MNRFLHSMPNFSTQFNQCVAGKWTPVKCSEDKFIYDSHFVAALVFFIATVERIVNTNSLSLFNPVTASNSYQFDSDLITDAFPKTVINNALGVTPFDPATVAFFNQETKINE